MTSSSILAIRPATGDDAAALARLAALDSAAIPHGDLLVGSVDGRPLAALSLCTGQVVADPFAYTDELVGLLRQRARRLRDGGVRTPSRPRVGLASRLRHRTPTA